MNTTEDKMNKNRTETSVDVLLSEAVNRTFDRNLFHPAAAAAAAEQKFTHGRVFGQDVPQLQAVRVQV